MAPRTAGGERAATLAAPLRGVPEDVGDTVPQDAPGTTHAAYARMLDRAHFCRRAALGTEGYRNAFEIALPRIGQESNESYFYRHDLVAAHNAVELAADSVVGFLNEQPAALEKGADAQLVTFVEDVDRAGTALALYEQESDYLAAIDGFVLGLVEHTKVDQPDQQTEDDEDRSGAGPYWLLYKLEDVINATYRTVNGVRTLVQLVLRDRVTRPSGRFGRKSIVKYRVYENNHGNVTCEVWTTDAAGKTVIELPAFPITNQTEIPCAIKPYGRRLGKFEWKPAIP